jgi:tetratricopeptide (TPR) repeat protein
MARALSVLRGAGRHGSGGVMLVCGPAGIGKTALLAEVCLQADRMGMRTVVGSCEPIEELHPAAPLIAALRAAREPIATGEQFEQIVRSVDEPLLLIERIADVLEKAAAAGPLLIAIDDVQWADRVSRFVIRALLSRMLGLPVVWLLASRDDDPRAGLVGFEVTRVEHIRLTPLSSPDLTAIAHDRLGTVPDTRTRGFLEACAGNPLLATQILGGMVRSAAHGRADAVPATFNAAVAQRLADLHEAARGLVALTAVAGRPLPLRDATNLLPSPPASFEAALSEAIESGLLVVTGDMLAPYHDLVREAVCAALPENDLRALHRSFAKYYLDARTDMPAAAAHARASAIPGDVASAAILLAAAERLTATCPDDAGDLAALAFRTVRPNQSEWLETGRRALSVLCRTQRANEAIAVADAILARVDDADLTGAIETQAARALWQRGRLSELLARVEPALTADTLDPVVRARLQAARALAGTRLQSGENAAREASRSLEDARATGDPDALAMALHAAGEAARNEARHRDALASYRELRGLTGAEQLAEEITTLQFLDRYDHAQTLLNEARADAENTTSSTLPALHCAQLWPGTTTTGPTRASTAPKSNASCARPGYDARSGRQRSRARTPDGRHSPKPSAAWPSSSPRATPTAPPPPNSDCPSTRSARTCASCSPNSAFSRACSWPTRCTPNQGEPQGRRPASIQDRSSRTFSSAQASPLPGGIFLAAIELYTRCTPNQGEPQGRRPASIQDRSSRTFSSAQASPLPGGIFLAAIELYTRSAFAGTDMKAY